LSHDNNIKIFEINEAKLKNEKLTLTDELNKQEYTHVQDIVNLKKEITNLKNSHESEINLINSTYNNKINNIEQIHLDKYNELTSLTNSLNNEVTLTENKNISLAFENKQLKNDIDALDKNNK